MKFKTQISLVLLAVLWSLAGQAQVYERSKQESRTFKAYESTSLEIYNKYGNINLLTWDKDSVRIEIKLEVKASKESKADKIFDYIDFEFSGSKYYIIARTTFKQNQGSFWTGVSDLANSMFSGNNGARIDYTVYMPAGMNVKLENKFGNIYCTDHSGKFIVNLSNGDFKANNLTGKAELDLSFGNAGINLLESGKVKGSYLEMDLASALEIFIESKSSTFSIGEVSMLKLNSRRDKFFIDQASSVTGVTSFSYITLTSILNYIQLTSEYGEVNVKGINPGFKQIGLDSKYTDVNLQLSALVNCKVDIQHDASTGIFFPDSFTGLSVTDSGNEGLTKSTTGFVGDKELISGDVNITIRSGKVSLQEEIQLF